jgi:hypothetical protein
MKLATIILAVALAAAGPFAFAQSGASGSSPGSTAAGAPATSGTVGSSAGGSTTSAAGSIAAGRNSAQNPSGNSYIVPPPGAPSGAGGTNRH